ncbi:MAG: rod shape-determining protein MreC, partial [Gammaproteobacteria bacterium]|nr:rod shape-determining protein MreC [Gammaproteobacteria bacterium]
MITLEITTRFLEPVRTTIGTVVSPLQFIAETPYFLGGAAGELFASRNLMLARNADLNRQILELSQISQQYLALKTENERLRELLGSQARVSAEVVIAELVAVVPAPNTHQIIIDKGTVDGVTVGQAVIDA